MIESVNKTRRLVVIDGGWKNSGFSAERSASVVESSRLDKLLNLPLRITLANSPAPTSKPLEDLYYPKVEGIVKDILRKFSD